MLLALMFVLLLIFLVCRFVHFLKLKSTISILFGIAVFIGCCIIGAAIYISYYGYSHNLSVDRKKLESFYVDLDTAQQYEEWFCPDERIMPIDDYFELYLIKTIKYFVYIFRRNALSGIFHFNANVFDWR